MTDSGKKNNIIDKIKEFSFTLVFALLVLLFTGDDIQATFGVTGRPASLKDYPVIGTLDKNDGSILYIADMADYEPEEGFFDYKLVTGSYEGNDFTFITDNSRNLRIIFSRDESGEVYLFAYKEQDNTLHPVFKMNFENEELFVTSVKACTILPNTLTEEEFESDTVFFGIGKDGGGAFYQYSSEAGLQRWGSGNESADNTGTDDRTKLKVQFTILCFVIAAATVALIILLRYMITHDYFWFIDFKNIKNIKKFKKPAIIHKAEKNIKSRPTSYFAIRKQYLFVIQELTTREIKRKYVGSKLGVIWSILNPLLMMIIMTLIFSFMFKRSIENFPLYYLAGSLMYSLFSEITNHTMTALVDNKSLLIKSKLPLQIFVLSRAYTALTNFAYSLIPFAVMLLVFRVKPTFYMLLLPVDALLLFTMSIGISFILSVGYVFFEDIKYLYGGVFLRIMMYMCALFYPVTSLPEKLQKLIGLNPVYMAVYIARECTVYGRMPYYTSWIKLALASAFFFILGWIIFKKNKNKIMQRI